MPQQQNKMAPVRGETTVPRHHNEPLVTSHKNRDSENHRSEFLFKVRKMAKNEIIFIQSEIVSFFFLSLSNAFLNESLYCVECFVQRACDFFSI